MRRFPLSLPLLAALLSGVVACGAGSDPPATPTSEAPHPSTTLPATPDAAGYAEALCRRATKFRSEPIADDALSEISGVVASPDQPGVLWVHDDSGSRNVIWAIDAKGAVSARITVQSAKAIDWEDIARHVDRRNHRTRLFLADTGDNSFTPILGRNLEPRSPTNPAAIYRIDEPDATDPDVASATATAIPVAYADGPRDAEAMLVDPISGDGFVISKQWDGSAAGLYRIPAPALEAEHPGTQPATMPRVADVAGTKRTLVTGADISLDGTLVAVRTYDAVRLWVRDPDHTVAETLGNRPSCVRRFAQHQGEAVGITDGGRTLVLISEGEHVPVEQLRVPAETRDGRGD